MTMDYFLRTYREFAPREQRSPAANNCDLPDQRIEAILNRAGRVQNRNLQEKSFGSAGNGSPMQHRYLAGLRLVLRSA